MIPQVARLLDTQNHPIFTSSPALFMDHLIEMKGQI